MIIAGFKDNGTADKVSGSVLEACGMVGDALVGNNNGKLRSIGGALDLVTQLGLGGDQKQPLKLGH